MLVLALSVVVSLISFASLWCVGSPFARTRVIGFLIGIGGQFVFAFLDIITGAYGLLLLFVVYVPLYIRAIGNQSESMDESVRRRRGG
jgi:hypothetical protein